MSNLGYSEAFAKYGAVLKNVQWSVCAQAPDESLVVSLWQHHFLPPKNGKATCVARFDRWKGPGNTEFRESVAAAFAADQRVRVVISHTDSPQEVEAGKDGSKLHNTFSVREDWIGRVSRITGEEYEFEFWRA